MSNNTFDINILVNGSRCKQYQHEGKTFIEARNGSEYVIEIKNNYNTRIEAVAAVDGLDVLTGKTANEQNYGYVVPAYSTEKIKGFRFSDDEWALFKFGYKMFGKTYAQSKQDGSEKNCGVIGVRLYYEYLPVQYTVFSQPNVQWYAAHPSPFNIISTSASWTPNSNQVYYTDNVSYGCSVNNSSDTLGGLYGKGKFGYSVDNGILRESKITAQNFTPMFEGAQPKGFDMGTEWGRREQSKVTSVSFSRGYLARQLDIYYASRDSLIEMGVPITNKIQVNLPQSFPSKYACPPPGWQ